MAARLEIEWRKLIGLRNRIVHDYLNIDVDMVWEHRHSPCWLMRCATGVSVAGSPSGEILNEEFLKQLDLTANALAKI